MAHRTPKINDTVKFTDQQQAILNDAVEKLMEAGGLTALTQAHFNEAMKIVAQRFINAALQGELEHHLTQEDENLNEEESAAERVENKRNGYSKKTLHGNKGDFGSAASRANSKLLEWPVRLRDPTKTGMSVTHRYPRRAPKFCQGSISALKMTHKAIPGISCLKCRGSLVPD